MSVFYSITDERLAELIRDGIEYGQSLHVGGAFRGTHGEGRHRGLEGMELRLFASGVGYGMSDVRDIYVNDDGIITGINRHA